MIRPLNGFERAAVVSNDYAPFNVVIAIHMENAPSPETLSSSLKKLQETYPLLRAYIEESGKNLWFQETANPPAIPLKVIPRQDESEWETVVEQEMARPIPKSRAPLFQATYIFSDDQADLILTAYHALIDGSSSTKLISQLLDFCTIEELPAENLPIRISKNPLPPSHRGLNKAIQLGRFGVSQMFGEINYRIKNRGKRVPQVHHGGHGKIYTTTFSKSLTSRLANRSRRERVTLNSVLNAAQLLAVNKILYSGNSAEMQTFTFADLRPYLKPPISLESLGGWVTLFRISVSVQENMDFWDLAKILHEKITKSLKRGDKFNAFLTSEGLLKMMTKMDKFRFGSSAINYSGVIPIAPQYGEILIKSIHGFVSAYDLAPELSSQARIFNDQIIWDFIYLDTDMDEPTASQLIQETIRILENAAD